MAIIKKFNDNAILQGTNGIDTLIAYGDDVLMEGKGGNDLYILGQNSAFDFNTPERVQIIEQAAGGTDTVLFHGDTNNYDGITLAENVENLKLGFYADYGYGNAGNNVMDASGAGGSFYGGANLFGRDGNDTLTGSYDDDSLYGDAGNDLVSGGRGDDWMYGGDGNDVLNGGYGNDSMYGQYGNDTLNGGDAVRWAASDFGDYGYGGHDNLFGGYGNDVLNGGNDSISSNGYGASLYAGSDSLYGEYGNDVLNGGNDTLTITDPTSYGSSFYGGTDWFEGGYGNDTLNGGDDRFIGGNGVFGGGNESFYAQNDTFYGDYGNDVINIGDTTVTANGGNDAIYGGYGYAHGGFGNDTINGGTNVLNAGDGDDFVFSIGEDTGDGDFFIGGYGNDVINGGRNTVLGGNGRDKIYGSMPHSYYGDQRTGQFSNDEFDGNDRITGKSETLDGGAGDDYIYAGYSTYYGGGGNDTIVGGSSTIIGGSGDDRVYLNGTAFNTIYGGYGNDSITAGSLTVNLGGSEGDHLYGDYGYGVGYARLFGGYGNDVLNGAGGGDQLDGAEGNDRLNGNGGNDYLYGGAANDVLNGGAGNDTLRGGYGGDVDNDTLEGGAGNDSFYVSWYGGTDTVTDGGGGDDTVWVYKGAFTAGAGIENIIDNGYGGAQTFTGNGSANFIYGGSSDDVLRGLAGDDVLDGGDGDDTMEGGLGNDNYFVDSYGDVVVEAAGAGTDHVLVMGYGYGDLAANVENMTLSYGAGGTTMFGNSLNNQLRANAYGNLVYGGEGNDTLIAGGGDDVLIGGKGNDLYIVEDDDDVVLEIGGEGTADTVRSDGSFRLGVNVENLVILSEEGDFYDGFGNALNNRLEGGAGNDFLNGYGGTDTLIGGAGDDFFVVDSTADVVTEAAGGGDFDWMQVDTAATTGTFTLAANVEQGELLGAGNLNLTGNSAHNFMYGNNGANIVDGGSAGNDSLHGGGGNDTLRGGTGNDFLYGDEGNDLMQGGTGNDVFFVNRGDGAGTAIAAANEDQVSEAALSGTDTVYTSTYTYTLDTNVENLRLLSGNTARKGVGNSLNNSMYGNSNNNVLSGLGGNDELYGAGGDDHLYGGDGNDSIDGGGGTNVLDGGNGNDRFNLFQNDTTSVVGGAGTDTVNFYGVSGANFDGFILGADVEHLNLRAGADYGYGNALANVIDASQAYAPFYGDVMMYGAEGNDTLIGSDFDDDMFGADDNDSLRGNAGQDFMYGDAGNDNLDGGDGVDRMYGQAGNDTLIGGVGDDYLDGGDGNDAMAGGADDDNYEVDSQADVVTEAANAGLDQIMVKSDTELTLVMAANVENAVVFFGGAYGDEGHNITGNALANFISGDYGGNTLSGGDGNDTIFGGTFAGTLFQFGTDGDVLNGDGGDDGLYGAGGDDTLNGGTGNDALYGGNGNDLMTGGAGNDVYHVDSGDGGAAGGDLGTEDRIVELAGGGTDTVEIFRNHAAYTLPDQVENLHVIDTGTAITATGNGLNNTFDIDTLADLDVLAGGAGTGDTLNAGVGTGDGSTTTTGFESINLEVSQNTDADWTVDAGDVAGQTVRINGSIADTSSIAITGLNASHTVILGDADQLQGFTTGTVSLGLQSDGGGDDDLNIVLGGSVFNIMLASNGEEHLNFEVRNTFNSINVANVVGEDDFYFSGSGRDVTVSGLDVGSTIRLQNLEVVNFTATLASDAGGADSLTLEVDNVVIGDPNDGGLFTSAALETLNIDTRGDAPFNNGASYIDGSGINTTATDVVLTGGQDLTVFSFGGDDFDASGFSGDLSGSFGAGATSLTAGTGVYNINMGSGVDTLIFGNTLTGADSINGGSSADTLSATLAAGTHILHISSVENLDFTLTGGVYVFDLGEIESGGTTVDIDLLGDAGSNVTFALPDFVSTDGRYSIDYSIATTGTLNATTGAQADTLVGGGGADTLRGGAGSDALTGGAGADFFVFDSLTGIDTIADFAPGSDKIQLSLGIFGEVGSVGTFDTTSFLSAAGVPVPVAANDHVLYNSTTGALFYDPDGDGATAAIQFATLTGNPALTSADFAVIS